MEAYEFFLDIPPTAILPMAYTLPAPMACDFGGDCGPENFIVGTGGICLAAPIQPLASYPAVMFLSAPGPDVPVCLSGAHPSSFPNGEPGYLVCNSPGDIRNFGRAYAGCAMINCTNCEAVPVEAVSFGAVKARF